METTVHPLDNEKGSVKSRIRYHEREPSHDEKKVILLENERKNHEAINRIAELLNKDENLQARTFQYLENESMVEKIDKTEKSKVQTGIRLDYEVYKDMKRFAVEDDTTPGALIEIALREYIDRRKSKNN